MAESEVIDLVAEALVVDRSMLDVESMQKTVVGWDSMGTMNILLALDAKFGLKLATGETKQLQSVRGIIDLLKRAGKM